MHYQHRSGLPSRPRNDDHTRWGHQVSSERTYWGGTLTIFIIVISLTVVVSL